MKIKILSTLALSMVIFGSSNAIYADSVDNNSKSISTISQNQNVSCPKDNHCHKGRGKSIIVQYLKEKYNMSDKEIQAQLDSGKTLSDILKAKQVKEDDLKKYIVKVRTSRIDTAIKDGKISKEKGNELKKKVQERVNNMDFDKMQKNKKLRNNR